MIERMPKKACHEAIRPLVWLLGRWKCIKGECSYPTKEPIKFKAELLFESMGQPLLNYNLTTWCMVKNCVIHLERGFLAIKPHTNQVAFLVALNTGAASLEEGHVSENELQCKSTQVVNMSFMEDPPTVALERVIKLDTNGQLEVNLEMATAKTPLARCLYSLYERC